MLRHVSTTNSFIGEDCRRPRLAISKTVRRPTRNLRAAARVSHAVCFTGEGEFPPNSLSKQPQDELVPVTFSICLPTGFGEHVRVVGNLGSLGGWEVEGALLLDWTDGHVWTATTQLPASDVEFKFVHIKPGCSPIWEESENRMLTVQQGKAQILTTKWGSACDDFQVSQEMTKDSTKHMHDVDCQPTDLEDLQAAADATLQPSGQPGACNEGLSAVTGINHKFLSNRTRPTASAECLPADDTQAIQYFFVAGEIIGEDDRESAIQDFHEGANYDADVESMRSSLEDVDAVLAHSNRSPTGIEILASKTLAAEYEEDMGYTAMHTSAGLQETLSADALSLTYGSVASQSVLDDSGTSVCNCLPLSQRVGITASSTAYGIATGALMSVFACIEIDADCSDFKA